MIPDRIAEFSTSPPLVPFRVSFDPEDLRIEGNPFRVNPSPFDVEDPATGGREGEIEDP